MKKIFPAIVLLAFTVIVSPALEAQKLSSYQSKWHPALALDNEEALINQMQLEEKSQFLFIVSNDDTNLFIELVVADQAAMQKIMRYGLTTWFNPEAKTKKGLGIEFPVTTEGQAQPDFMRDKSADRKEMRKAMMAAKNQEMTLIGFDIKGDRKVINPQKDPDFEGNIEMMEGGRLKVSISVPLEKLQRGDAGTFNEPISIGFETGYMDVTGQGTPSGSTQQQGGGGHSGGMYGGGGPPPSGGSAPGSMSGGSEQQERPDISKLASPSKLWIKEVLLSKQP